MASVQTLSNNAKSIGMFAIVIAIVLAVVQGVQNAGVLTGDANTTVGQFITALGTFGDWIGIIVVAIVGLYLMGFFKK